MAPERQLERKLGNRNSCILSKDRYALYRGRNLPSLPFDCRATKKQFRRASDWNTPTKNRGQIFLIEIVLQIMVCKLTNLSDFTPDKNLSCSEASDGVSEVWYALTKSEGTGDRFFRKINKICPVRLGPQTT